MSRTKASTRRDMHPEQIKAAVRMSGITLTALAIKAQLSESACRNALRKRSGRADQAIAQQIGKSLEDIWPSRYPTRHERDQNSRSGASAHRLTAQAV